MQQVPLLTGLVITIPTIFTFALEFIGPKARESKGWRFGIVGLGIVFTGVTVLQVVTQQRAAVKDRVDTVQETVQKTTANVTSVLTEKYVQMIADGKQANDEMLMKLTAAVAKQFDEHKIPKISKALLKEQVKAFVKDVLGFLTDRATNAPKHTAQDDANSARNLAGFEERARAYDRETINLYRESEYIQRCFMLSAQLKRYGIEAQCVAAENTNLLSVFTQNFGRATDKL